MEQALMTKRTLHTDSHINNGDSVGEAREPVDDAGDVARPPDVTAAEEGAGADPFDADSLRIVDDDETVRPERQPRRVLVRKPPKSEYVRVHPDPAYTIHTGVIELKDDRATYLVAPSLRAELEEEATYSRQLLHTAITRGGDLFLWPVRLPGPDGRDNDWNRSALEAAVIAREKWVRVLANLKFGVYDIYVAHGRLSEPQWPDRNITDILRIAFKDFYIDTLDHMILRRLRGEA
jgi:hypothetical protein